nr:MAG TPA: tail assembly chaperone [Caudoviricetes sp.]
MHAKLISDTQIERAPKNKGSWVNFDKNTELLTADGYLPVIVIEEATTERPIVKYRQLKGRIEQYAEAAPVPAVPEPTAEQQEMQVRAQRNSLLSLSDWTQLADAPLTTEQKQAWAEYRQALRDVPEQADFPDAVVWPFSPEQQ